MAVTKCVDRTLLRLDFQDRTYSNPAMSPLSKVFRPKEIVINHKIVKQAVFLNESSGGHKDNSSYSSKPNNLYNDNDVFKNGIVVSCLANWYERGLHYLITRQINKPPSFGYRCMIYKRLRKPHKSIRKEKGAFNPAKDLIQLFLMNDEFCEHFDLNNLKEGLKTFTLEKVNSQSLNSNTCMFLNVLNNKWTNIERRKELSRINTNQIQIMHSTESSRDMPFILFSNLKKKEVKTSNKRCYAVSDDLIGLNLTCIETLRTTQSSSSSSSSSPIKNSSLIVYNFEYIYLVNNMVKWYALEKMELYIFILNLIHALFLLSPTIEYQCLAIEFKSDFVVQVKYGTN